ncbi:SDR family oxidoreductase [Chitinophaga qingshengii]|uniref:NAD(P)H-binding protein n=1 Tax=Chitinophaga qingshengii TaxID=1569794 RepID=A0ABR7TGX1_9BACT|nr:NAD(P)H-binding protein [Chitinophaga qingshengii]MBC9929732.1 NAD(P)H-binding protein [Chitinophaga qingshengii]
MQQTTVLILGGTGKTGRRIAQLLEAKNRVYRVGSRSGSPAFDWEAPATWKPALEGVATVYLSYYPDLAVPGAVDTIRTFTQVMVAGGVKRVVLLSGRGEPEAQACEEIVMDSGLEWTILRCAWFSQNFSEGYLLEPLQAGFVALPAGGMREPFIDADDIADVAVAALTEDGHAGELYELTGPRLLTFAEAVAEVAQATGRSIEYQHVPMGEYIDMLRQYGIPEDHIWLISYLFTEVLDGRNESLGNGVQRALKRTPRDFGNYAHATAATGIWNEQ